MRERDRMNEKKEEEDGPWEEVKRRMWDVIKPLKDTEVWIEVRSKKKKNKTRKWDALPSIALLSIFCKSELKDRLQSIPLVCKSWKYVSDDPRVWSSMIPDSVSPEDAFIKNTSGYVFEDYQLKFGKKKEELRGVGLSRLQTLIKKSGGGAAITTLYLSPFFPDCYWWFGVQEYDKINHLIANCCPNLKHIFLGRPYDEASIEARLHLFNKCKKLELIDLWSFGFDDDNNGSDDDIGALVIQEMGKCLPNLRGIRTRDCEPFSTTFFIAASLPQLKLLSLRRCLHLNSEHLSAILCSCLELQYLYVEGYQCMLPISQDIIDRASAQIPEFYFEKHYDPWSDYQSDDYSERLESTEHMLKCNETDIDDYSYILKQRKEDQYVSILRKDQDVSILKKKIKYYTLSKKKERDQCNSRLKTKKKKYQYDSTLKEKKKDQCDYTDYVIH